MEQVKHIHFNSLGDKKEVMQVIGGLSKPLSFLIN